MNSNLNNAVNSIERCIREANSHYLRGCQDYQHDIFNEDHQIAEYLIEKAFIELLVLVDHLKLTNIYAKIDSLLNSVQTDKKGFLKSAMGIDEPYLVWCEKIRMYLDGISGAHGLGESAESEARDIKDIIRRSLYVICDTTLFPTPPQQESDVHDRIEAILKCNFPDLKRKPTLSKPIKNFEPDTGIPSSRTLIEYKFVTKKTEAKRVVDEILADSSGYRSMQWKNLIFVIYETRRVMPEEEWNNLLKECELGSSYGVIVLSGDAK